MEFTEKDLQNIANRDFILGNSTAEELQDFITEQIEKPFDSGSTNYFKKLKKIIPTQDQLDALAEELLKEIENTYSKLEFDLSEFTGSKAALFEASYKFFVKNVNKLMYVFLREYIFNNKNRKVLVGEFMSSKMPTYPKEQYGKKEYYILVTKLPAILESIKDDNITLDTFIDYLERSDKDMPLYADSVREYFDKGIICDTGIVESMFEVFNESDARPGILNKLEMDITTSLIIPYMKETGMLEHRIVPDAEPEEDLDDDEEESDD